MSGLMQRARTLATNPAAAAMMLAATRHKAETGVKNESDARAAKDENAEVTFDVGKGTISAKGVSVEDLGQVQQDAYDKPYGELAAISRRMATQMQREDENADEEQAGNQWSGVLPNIADLWRGKGAKDNYRRAKQLQMKRDEARFYDEMAKEEKKRADAATKQEEKVTKQRSAARAEIGRSDDLRSLTTSDVAVRAGVDEATVADDPVLADAMRAQRIGLTLKGAKEAATARRARVSALKREDVEDGTFEQWKADTETQVGELSPSELGRARAYWRSAEDKVNDEHEREASKLRAEARSIAGQARAATAAERAADAAERSAGASERAARGETRSIEREKNHQRRAEINRIGGEIDQVYAKIQANSLAFTKTKKPNERAELQRQNKELTMKQRQLFGALTALRGGKSVAAPAPAAAPIVTGRKGALSAGEGGTLRYTPKGR